MTAIIEGQSNEHWGRSGISALKLIRSVLTLVAVLGLTAIAFGDSEAEASASVVFSDDFESANLDKWSVISGDWDVISVGQNHIGHLLAGSVQNRRMVSIASVPANITLTARTKGNATGDSHADCSIGFFSNSDASSYYFVMLGGTPNPDFWIGMWNGGSVYMLVSESLTALPNNEWYDVKVRLEGNHVDVKVWPDGGSEPADWQLSYTAATRFGDHIVLGTAHGTDNEEFWFDVVEAVITPAKCGDVNCDSEIDISDAVYLIAYIFSGGPEPCAECK